MFFPFIEHRVIAWCHGIFTKSHPKIMAHEEEPLQRWKWFGMVGASKEKSKRYQPQLSNALWDEKWRQIFLSVIPFWNIYFFKPNSKYFVNLFNSYVLHNCLKMYKTNTNPHYLMGHPVYFMRKIFLYRLSKKKENLIFFWILWESNPQTQLWTHIADFIVVVSYF